MLFLLKITIYPNRKSVGKLYLYHYISKENKFLATEKFARFKNIKSRL